jgi:hypothetical protein
MEDMHLSFGEHNMSPGMLAKFRGLCPGIRRLSVRISPFRLPYALHSFGPVDWSKCSAEVEEAEGKGFDDVFPEVASEFVKFKSLTCLVALTCQDDPDWLFKDHIMNWQGAPQEFVTDPKWWPREFCDRWGEINPTLRDDMVCKSIFHHLEMAAEDLTASGKLSANDLLDECLIRPGRLSIQSWKRTEKLRVARDELKSTMHTMYDDYKEHKTIIRLYYAPDEI